MLKLPLVLGSGHSPSALIRIRSGRHGGFQHSLELLFSYPCKVWTLVAHVNWVEWSSSLEVGELLPPQKRFRSRRWQVSINETWPLECSCFTKTIPRKRYCFSISIKNALWQFQHGIESPVLWRGRNLVDIRDQEVRGTTAFTKPLHHLFQHVIHSAIHFNPFKLLHLTRYCIWCTALCNLPFLDTVSTDQTKKKKDSNIPLASLATLLARQLMPRKRRHASSMMWSTVYPLAVLRLVVTNTWFCRSEMPSLTLEATCLGLDWFNHKQSIKSCEGFNQTKIVWSAFLGWDSIRIAFEKHGLINEQCCQSRMLHTLFSSCEETKVDNSKARSTYERGLSQTFSSPIAKEHR